MGVDHAVIPKICWFFWSFFRCIPGIVEYPAVYIWLVPWHMTRWYLLFTTLLILNRVSSDVQYVTQNHINIYMIYNIKLIYIYIYIEYLSLSIYPEIISNHSWWLNTLSFDRLSLPNNKVCRYTVPLVWQWKWYPKHIQFKPIDLTGNPQKNDKPVVPKSWQILCETTTDLGASPTPKRIYPGNDIMVRAATTHHGLN